MRSGAPALITLTTDFGTGDFYVAAMKGAMLRHCPSAVFVDVTHAVPRHDVLFGAIMLERAIAAFAPGTVHLAVVDPGVGTARRLLVARWPQLDQTIVCPDNGLIGWAWHRHGPAECHELIWRPASASPVFHGRDILGPAAAMLAAGTPLDQLARPCVDPVSLPARPAVTKDQAVVIHIDHFGNATTNVPEVLAVQVSHAVVQGRTVGPLRQTYGEVLPGEPLILIGSSGLLEVAIREGSAARDLGLAVGDRIELR